MRSRTISWAFALVGAGALFAATLVSPAKAQPSPKAAAGATKKQTQPAKKPASKTKAAAKPAPAKKTGPASKTASKEKSAAPSKATPPTTKKSRPQRTASTQPVSKSKPAARGKKTRKPEPPCFRPTIQLMRGLHRAESESLSLTFCDGKPAPQAVEFLSILARPNGAPRPKRLPNTPPPAKAGRKGAKGKVAAKGKGKAKTAEPPEQWSPGLKLVDEGLVTRLQQVVDHFKAKRVYLISGYRPESDRSFHQSAKALDFRVEGVKNEALVAFCRTLPDTGCGYYPNSSFVHMDVRPAKTGHIYWIDASGPGEAPRYVSSWPPKENAEPGDENVVLDPAITGESAPSSAIAMTKPKKGKEQAAFGDLPPLDEAPSLLEALGADLALPSEAMQPLPAGEEESL